MLLQAIRDGVVNASIDHTQGWVKSKVSLSSATHGAIAFGVVMSASYVF
jgi:hypothetical protein